MTYGITFAVMIVMLLITLVFGEVIWDAYKRKSVNCWIEHLPKPQQHYVLQMMDWCNNHSTNGRCIFDIKGNELQITCHSKDYYQAYSSRDACREKFYIDGRIQDGKTIAVVFIGNHNRALCAAIGFSTSMGDVYHD